MKTIVHIAQASGGVERYLYALLGNMDKTKYRNILICSQSYNIEKFKDLAEQIEIVKMYRETNLFNELKAVCKIRKIIKKYVPDVVYMHSSKAGALGRIANLGLHNVSIYNAHGWSFNMRCSNLKKWIYVWIEKMLAPFCTKIVAISDYEKEIAIKKRLCNPEKIKVIYNGIDFKEYENINPVKRYNIGIPEDAFVIGTVGRLTAQKAPDIFIKAAKVIKTKIPSAFFLMVGDGDLKSKTEELIEKNKLKECFKITGWVENPIDYISTFDVATLLSRWEGFGLVLAEYMISQKPIIATKADAIPNIISDDENGLLVEIDDYNSIATKVVELYKDINVRNRLGMNGMKDAKNRFDIRRVVKEHESIF